MLSTYFLFVETICRSILLLILTEHVDSGKNLPDDLSATDQLCAWKYPNSNLAFFTFLEC